MAIQAYVDPEDGIVDALEDARTEIRDRHRVATTVGLGPRFLHSTGQLHKGGPPSGVFLQVVGDDPDDVAIPGQAYGFSDAEARPGRGRPAAPSRPTGCGPAGSPSQELRELTR